MILSSPRSGGSSWAGEAAANRMSITWLNAAALWGLTLIAIPIAIHLLVRQQTRVVKYPSLRFVRETALAAFRRRTIQDALLLACRIAAVAAAALALAGPVIHTAARTARYADRVSIAIVRLDDTAVDRAIATNAFRSRTFQRSSVADSLNDAIRWLDAQPPSSRQIVITGAFRKGQIAQSDLHAVPVGVGVRFANGARPPAIDRFTLTTLARRDGRTVFEKRNVRVASDTTEVTGLETTPAPEGLIRIVSPAADEALANAALDAALGAGLRWPNPNRRIVVVWGTSAVVDGDAEILRMPVPAPPATAATAVWRLVDAATPREAIEPLEISRAELDAWSRPASGIAPHAHPGDEGDRRWLWAMALAFLAIEQLLRRNRDNVTASSAEARVA